MWNYAHNYLSMKSLLAFAKEQHPDGEPLVITGSTGNKAESRREGLSQAIAEYADVAILTSEYPNFEDPKKIADEIVNKALKMIMYAYNLKVIIKAIKE